MGVRVQNNVDFYISVSILLFLKFILGHKAKKLLLFSWLVTAGDTLFQSYHY